MKHILVVIFALMIVLGVIIINDSVSTLGKTSPTPYPTASPSPSPPKDPIKSLPVTQEFVCKAVYLKQFACSQLDEPISDTGGTVKHIIERIRERFKDNTNDKGLIEETLAKKSCFVVVGIVEADNDELAKYCLEGQEVQYTEEYPLGKLEDKKEHSLFVCPKEQPQIRVGAMDMLPREKNVHCFSGFFGEEADIGKAVKRCIEHCNEKDRNFCHSGNYACDLHHAPENRLLEKHLNHIKIHMKLAKDDKLHIVAWIDAPHLYLVNDWSRDNNNVFAPPAVNFQGKKYNVKGSVLRKDRFHAYLLSKRNPYFKGPVSKIPCAPDLHVCFNAQMIYAQAKQPPWQVGGWIEEVDMSSDGRCVFEGE